MSEARVEIPRAFKELFTPSRYKAYFGGRGSGKSHSFAAALVIRASQAPLRVLCAREIQKSIGESVKALIDAKIRLMGLPGFRSTDTYVEHANGGAFHFVGLRTDPDKIKSMEGIDIAWVEEANKVSRRALDLLIPTLRKEGSELWFSWNPEYDFDPVDAMFRGERVPPDSIVRRVGWRDNPFFPKVLRTELEFDRAHNPDKYEHVWEGEYIKVHEGAYYTAQLRQARDEGRIARLVADPLLQVRTFWDLGVTDSMSIWIAQWVGQEIRCLDYIEGQGQPLGYYLTELRSRGYDKALCVLPHDGSHTDLLTAKRLEDHVRAAGFPVQVVKNQGKGAAMKRVEAARRVFPRVSFDGDRCAGGLKALGAYHERRDEERNVGLGPEHDWSSHGADAFGLMCAVYDEPKKPQPRREPQGVTSWMS